MLLSPLAAGGTWQNFTEFTALVHMGTVMNRLHFPVKRRKP